MRALVVLCVAGAGALQYDAAALRQALGAAKPLQDGTVIFRREWRERAGDGAVSQRFRRAQGSAQRCGIIRIQRAGARRAKHDECPHHDFASIARMRCLMR